MTETAVLGEGTMVVLIELSRRGASRCRILLRDLRVLLRVHGGVGLNRSATGFWGFSTVWGGALVDRVLFGGRGYGLGSVKVEV